MRRNPEVRDGEKGGPDDTIQVISNRYLHQKSLSLSTAINFLLLEIPTPQHTTVQRGAGHETR